jgi:esterase/lipase superfamily enzyme
MSEKTGKTPRRRRWLIVATVLALVAAGWLTYEILLSPSAAIRQAEAFLFRRMTVVRIDEGQYRYFYVSNRRLDPGEESIEDRVTDKRDENLYFGSYDIRLSPLLGLGLDLSWSDMLQTEMIRLDDIRELPQADFVRNLREYVDASPARSVFIMVHGFRERFPLALRRTAFFASMLDANTPVMVFDWPADQQGLLGGYRDARRVAAESASELARTLKIIVEDVEPDQISILGNSLGAQVVVDAFSHLYADAGFRDPAAEFGQVFLTAPDVSRAKFNEQFRNEITALVDELTVYVASNDRALIVSRLISGEPRAGESTVDPDQLAEAVELSRIIEPGDELITLIDVTPVNRTRNFHNFYVESPEFFDDLYLRLTTVDTPSTRRIHRVVTPDQSTYWVLTRGR